MATQLHYTPDPVVGWAHTRLQRRAHKSAHVFADDIWDELLADFGLPPDAMEIEGRNRTEIMHLVRATLGLPKQKAKRRGDWVGGCYEYVDWSDVKIVPDEEKITVVLT